MGKDSQEYIDKYRPRKTELQRLRRDKELYAMSKFSKIIDNAKKFNILESDDIIIGLLLSDASLIKFNKKQNSKFVITQVEKGDELVLECQKHLNDLSINTFYYKFLNHKVNNWYSFLGSSFTPFFSDLRRKWYPNGKKIVPRDLVLTPKMLAWWFMGDGSSSWIIGKERTGVRLYLYTQGFPDNDVYFLRDLLENIFGLEKVIVLQRIGGKCLTIGSSENVNKFMSIIEPYMLNCFRYKIKYSNKLDHRTSSIINFKKASLVRWKIQE